MNTKQAFVKDCLFCRIATGEIASKIVYQDDDIVAFHDIQPQAPWHILLIPRWHVANSLYDLQAEDGPVVLKLFDVARNLANELGIQESGYRLVTNNGPDAGQSVFHLHFHLLGGAPLGLFGTPRPSVV